MACIYVQIDVFLPKSKTSSLLVIYTHIHMHAYIPRGQECMKRVRIAYFLLKEKKYNNGKGNI